MKKLFDLTSKYIFPSNPTTGSLGSIHLNIVLIQWSGIPLLGIRPESRSVKVLLSVYGALIVTFVTFLYTVLEIYDLVFCCGNLNQLTQNICLSLTHVTGAVKVVNAFYRRSEIIRIIEQFKVMTRRYVISEDQKTAFFWAEFENKIPLIVYATIVGFTGILGMIMLMINPVNIAGQIFPYRVKMPQLIPYSVQVPYMALAVLLYALQIVGIDYLNVNLINQTRFQMKTLNIAFDQLAVDEVDFDTNKYINNLVEYHTIILQIRTQIEDVFKFPLLLQFLTSLIICAMTGFQATVQSHSQTAILIYFYCGCIFCELFVYCWFGNEVSEQNKTLAFRGYNSPWYDFNRKYCKTLIIFLVNAQRPFSFTAGGFVDLSLGTFSRILSKSYTYIAVLRQIYATK